MSSPRIKDASFIQLHIEKLILAFGVLVFGVGVFLFVLGNPFAIEVNRQAYDKPADAVDVLKRTDSSLEAGLQNPDPLEEIVIPNFLEDFMAMKEQPVDADMQLTSLSNPGLTLQSVYPTDPEPSRYALVYPPAPKNITHVSGTDVLDKDFDPKATATFYELWGKEIQEPGDFAMFIAAGEFDIYQWITRLKEESKEDGAIQIPAGIWAQRFGIAGVVLLRETWDPVEGRWGQAEYVEPLPGQYRMLPEAEAPAETNAALTEIALLREGQIELAQPDLPWLKGFVQAIAPGGESVGADGFIQGLDKENLGPAEKEILKLEEQIRQLEEQRAKRLEKQAGRNNPGRTNPGRLDRGGPEDFDPGPGSGAREPRERRDPVDQRIERLRERIESKRPQALREEENRKRLEEEKRLRDEERARREQLQAQRDQSVFGGADDPLAAAGISGMNLKEGSSLRVWAADPSMRPGETYRYKLLVSVINPLYAVPRLAADQLDENRQRAALLPTKAEIDAMPWIGPIKVEPESRFFFTSGRENSASVDIYRRYNGELIYQDFDGAPGDTIGSLVEVEDEFGNIQEIDMRVGSVIVGVDRQRDPLSTGAYINTLIIMDKDGTIRERVESLDKSSPARKELSDQKKDGVEKPLRPAEGTRPGTGEEFFPGDFGPGGVGF